MASFGKKTRSPGYKSGDHWLTCDVCGFAIYSSDAMKRWDGAVVCPEDFETRHPQDLRRGVHDDITPKGLVRSEPNDNFNESISYASVSDNTVPSGTFNETTL